jgi:signal transduction histidine kinase
LQKQGIDVRQFVHETLYEQQMCAAKKGSSVLMETVCDGLLNADRVKLKQVVDNLLSNAIKYSPVGSTIFFGCRAEEPYCVFYVRDEGPGLSADDREQLFQDFKRLSSVPTGGERSIGLGLAISKRIVEAHHGRIEVDSSLGKGSTFTVALPWD